MNGVAKNSNFFRSLCQILDLSWKKLPKTLPQLQTTKTLPRPRVKERVGRTTRKTRSKRSPRGKAHWTRCPQHWRSGLNLTSLMRLVYRVFKCFKKGCRWFFLWFTWSLMSDKEKKVMCQYLSACPALQIIFMYCKILVLIINKIGFFIFLTNYLIILFLFCRLLKHFIMKWWRWQELIPTPFKSQ